MVSGRWLAQSAERTAAVTEYYVRAAGIDSLEFFDNNFFVHQARVRDYAERIAHLNVGVVG